MKIRKTVIPIQLLTAFVAGIFLVALSPQASAQTTLVISEDSTFEDAIITTEKMQGQLGTSIVKGDFNNDGIDDFAIGAIREGAPRVTDEVGMVTVFFGGSSINNLPAWVKTGKETDGYESARLYDTIAGNWVGVLMAVGDLNNDGTDDLVVAAQAQADDDHSSKVFIVFGQNITGDVNLGTQADVILSRDEMHVGALAAGDLDNDGVADLAIADIMTSSTTNPPVVVGHTPSGCVYVVKGKSSWPGAIDLKAEADTTFVRDGGSSVFQVAGMAIGDVNNDQAGDLILGAPEENNPSYSLDNAGRVYMVFGGSGFPSGTTDIDTTYDVVVYGGEADDKIGGSLEVTDHNDQPIAVGDVNGDGIGDVLIGAPLSMLGGINSTGKGKVEILYGKSNWSSPIDLYDGYDIRLRLSQEAATIGIETGFCVAVEDVNGDGKGDIVIGSHHAPTPKFNGYFHVIYGKSGLSKNYDQLESQSDLLITTESPPDRFGDSHLGQTFAVGDFNNSGKPDVLLGAPKGTGLNSATSAGWAAMIFDVATETGTVETPSGCATLNALGQLSIPCVDLSAISPVAISLILVPDAFFVNWTIQQNGVAVVAKTDACVPLVTSPAWRLELPCVDLSILGSKWGNWKVAFDINTQTYVFKLDMTATSPLN